VLGPGNRSACRSRCGQNKNNDASFHWLNLSDDTCAFTAAWRSTPLPAFRPTPWFQPQTKAQ
jgi:hypothetical protein